MLPNQEIVQRLVVAAFLGSLIGFERERLLWAAGLRTHMLVCVGSCLVMIVSAFGFADVLNNDHVSLDPSRIAAQVVSGIGFLGAGAILLRGEVIRGLTTAASLWAVAGVGLAVGGGLYLASIEATAIMLIILAGIKPLEERYRERRQSFTLSLKTMHGALSLDTLKDILQHQTSHVKQFIVERGEEPGQDKVIISFTRMPRVKVAEIALQLRKMPTVIEVNEM